MAPIPSTSAPKSGMVRYGDIVEIGLLLPASRANALLELSKRTNQSVGQLLRSMIDRELMEHEELHR